MNEIVDEKCERQKKESCEKVFGNSNEMQIVNEQPTECTFAFLCTCTQRVPRGLLENKEEEEEEEGQTCVGL